jgi:serine/threonine protein kinase
MSPFSGLLLARRYQLDSPIAAGGFGEVWRAADVLLGRPVAIKLLQAGYLQHPETLARFRAEARHTAGLSHPNVAHIYDYGEPDPPHPPFLVMELVDGPPLAEVLASGAMEPARAMDIVAQAANGLQAAHRAGLVHRDIKPGNLLLSGGGLVKITDFGIAHAAGSAPVTGTGMVMGTPAYLAPERVRGSSATAASDLYALGIVGYECLAGTPPFSGVPVAVALAHRDSPLPPLPASVPADVAALVTDLTAKDPAARPASAAEVAARAGQLRDRMLGRGGAGPRGQRPASRPPRTISWPGRSPQPSPGRAAASGRPGHSPQPSRGGAAASGRPGHSPQPSPGRAAASGRPGHSPQPSPGRGGAAASGRPGTP